MSRQKYHVVVSPVRELSLLGTADLAYWSPQLAALGLQPAVADGHAQLVVTTADMRFKGIRFRELSISIFVTQQAGSASRDGAYLLQAWNSVRFFAWVERTFFHTPYAFGQVVVDGEPPVGASVVCGATTLFSAAFGRHDSAPPRTPSRCGEEHWEGPIFLPDSQRRPGGPRRLFMARIGGPTTAYPFLANVDELRIEPTPQFPALQRLVDSNFTGREWLVRPAATHGKGKTIRARGEEFFPSHAAKNGQSVAV